MKGNKALFLNISLSSTSQCDDEEEKALESFGLLAWEGQLGNMHCDIDPLFARKKECGSYRQSWEQLWKELEIMKDKKYTKGSWWVSSWEKG